MATFEDDDYRSDPFGTRTEENGSFATASGIDLDYFTVSNRADIVAGAATVSVYGLIDIINDVDVYRFEVLPDESGDPGGQTFTFDIDGAQNADGSGLDSQIQLFDSAGGFLWENDDGYAGDVGSASNSDSYRTWTPTAVGVYYIAVTSYNNDWRGGAQTGGASAGDYFLHIGVTGAPGVRNYGDGTLGNDLLEGDSNGDVRNDTIDAYAGDDDVNGGFGDDTLYGGDGADTVIGSDGNDHLYGDDDNYGRYNFVHGGFYEGPGDNDTLDGGAGDDYLYGGRGDDTLLGGSGIDNLGGGDGSDRIDGGAGADVFSYEAASVAATSAADADVYVIRYLESVPGANDSFAYGGSHTGFDGAGVAGGDTIEFAGLTGPTFFRGHVDHGTLSGDFLPGGGNGVIDAYYTYSFDSRTWLTLDVDDSGTVSANDVMVRWDKLVNLIPSDFAAGQVFGPTLGTTADDSFTGLATPDFFQAGAGVDTVRGGGGVDLIEGEGGADKLYGDAGDDSLNGGTENDLLEGGAGNDTLDGGEHVDTATYYTATGRVTVDLALTGAQNTGGAGVDRLRNIENLNGSNNWSDTLYGTDFANTLSGFNWHDTLRGRGGADVLNGGNGNDVLDGGAGTDRLNGDAGMDTATYYYATGAVTVSLAKTLQQNTGGAGLDTLSSIENLNGSNGFGDTLTGSTGANVLRGYGGRDTLTGNGGADRFVFGALAECGATVAAADRITDLGADDKIDLSLIVADAVDGKFARLEGDGAFTAAGQLRLTLHGADTWLELNTDADATAEAVIVLTGNHTAATAEDGWLL